MTILGVILILVAVYLFAKPHIDNYLHEKDNDNKIEQYDKQDKSSNKQTPTIPRIKLKWQGIYQCQMQRLKNQCILTSYTRTVKSWCKFLLRKMNR